MAHKKSVIIAAKRKLGILPTPVRDTGKSKYAKYNTDRNQR